MTCTHCNRTGFNDAQMSITETGATCPECYAAWVEMHDAQRRADERDAVKGVFGNRRMIGMLLFAAAVITGTILRSCESGKNAEGTRSGMALNERVQARIRRIDPKITLKVVDEHTIEASFEKWGVHVSLDNVELSCKDGEQACADAIEALGLNLDQVWASRDAATVKLDPATVRLTIKPAEWLESARRHIEAAPVDMRSDNAIVTKPFVAGLSIVYVADQPRGMTMVTAANLRELGLDRDQLDALARKNLEAARPLAMSQLGESGIWTNDAGDDYDAALLALPHVWKPLVDKLGGSLVVSIPSRNRVFAVSARGNVDAVRKVTSKAFAEEHHAISDQLFTWSARGFTPLTR